MKPSKLIRTIPHPQGEINVYRDSDGFHAERWNEGRQYIDRQSGDCRTAKEAIEIVS